MSAVIDFLVTNYIWFLVGAIIILLAIIGRYADKSNFGRGKEEKTETVPNADNQEDLNQPITAQDETAEANQDMEATENTVAQEVQPTEPVTPQDNATEEVNVEENNEENFEALDEAFNNAIPQKKIGSEGLLEEIDKLSLDKTENADMLDIPVVDNVDLPEIKDLREDEDDIWRF